MKYSVGYQIPETEKESFSELVLDYIKNIEEVYFPWIGMSSGRADITNRRGYVNWSGQNRLEEDLKIFKKNGIKLNLLFNANCYGAAAVSQYLQEQVVSVIEHLNNILNGIYSITTTSPAIAYVVKNNFPDIEVRASVNMRIGTIQGMGYLSSLFDAFYVQKEYNRDLEYLKSLKNWADKNGKNIYLLANSGCLANCSGQIFHDNLVAHDREIDETVNLKGFTPMICWSILKDLSSWPAILRGVWIRPEDVHHYEELVPVMKLATRMHANPRLVIDAYTRGVYNGNLLNLFEPGFGSALAPYVIDSSRFPADWFEKTSKCMHRCENCDYCKNVLESMLVNSKN